MLTPLVPGVLPECFGGIWPSLVAMSVVSQIDPCLSPWAVPELSGVLELTHSCGDGGMIRSKPTRRSWETTFLLLLLIRHHCCQFELATYRFRFRLSLSSNYHLLSAFCYHCLLHARTLSPAIPPTIFGSHGQHLEKRHEKAVRLRHTWCYSHIDSNCSCSGYRYYCTGSETHYCHHNTKLVWPWDCDSWTDRREYSAATAGMAKGWWHSISDGDTKGAEGFEVEGWCGKDVFRQ